MDLSFSGAGFMGCYYFGVVNCWNKYIPRERVHRVAGASAGSLIAAYYLMDLPLQECLKIIIEMTEDARSRPLGVFDRSNQIVDVLPRALDQMFPEDAHKRVNGRLHVAMTRLKDFKSVIINEFESRQDLIDALNCSCFIPVWSGNHVSTYKGVKYIDGGFTNNMPVFDEHTIRVCCFSGASDIAPYDKARSELLRGCVQGMSVDISWKNLRRIGRALWPPPAVFITELLKIGFHDTKEFILDNDLIQCDRCFATTERESQPIYSRLTPTISPAASPSASRAPSMLNLDELQRANSGKGSFRLRLSKRAGSKRRAKQRQADGCESYQAPAPPPVRIKEHRRMSTGGFETNRSKSGKQIARKDMERLKLEAQKELEREQGLTLGKAGFASKLREKLQQVASKSAAEKPPREQAEKALAPMPTIVVEELDTGAPADLKRLSLDATEPAGPDPGEAQKPRASSLSSSHTSTDSAVVLESPGTASSLMSGSPSEKFLAGSKQRAQSVSLSGMRNLLGGQLEARFSLAPSPLPSCPPSPNLNRHCTECIRLRQMARLDDLDESVRNAAEMYSCVKSKEPESEFNSLRWKLACWLRQIGAPKYSYSFGDELDAPGPDNDDDEAGETMAERKARRKASHPLAWPLSAEIQAGS